jgi:uncharacterized membrane protein
MAARFFHFKQNMYMVHGGVGLGMLRLILIAAVVLFCFLVLIVSLILFWLRSTHYTSAHFSRQAQQLFAQQAAYTGLSIQETNRLYATLRIRDLPQCLAQLEAWRAEAQDTASEQVLLQYVALYRALVVYEASLNQSRSYLTAGDYQRVKQLSNFQDYQEADLFLGKLRLDQGYQQVIEQLGELHKALQQVHGSRHEILASIPR